MEILRVKLSLSLRARGISGEKHEIHEIIRVNHPPGNMNGKALQMFHRTNLQVAVVLCLFTFLFFRQCMSCSLKCGLGHSLTETSHPPFKATLTLIVGVEQ